MKDETRKPQKSEKTSTSVGEGSLARFGLKLASWCERWFPDPLIFAFAGVVARAVDASGNDYGTMLPMKEIK